MTVPEVTFTLDSPGLAREALSGLASRFRTRRDGKTETRRTYYDTFDWRLYREGSTLSAERGNGGWLLCLRRRDGSPTRRVRVERVPEFARDLEATPFRDELGRITEIRRLLPIVRLESRDETIAVLDRREKTVARVLHERGSASAFDARPTRRMADRLRVVPVLGYDDDHRSVVRFLEQMPGLAPCEGGELDLALAAAGKRACSYTSKLDVPLEPRMRADEAAKRILARLLETMRANEDGTRRDLDPEFLHDFRVAGRRTRSCLGQVKGLFDPRILERFRREFAWLGRATGRTRDLDVYLLKMDDYRREVPASLHPGLDGLEDHLRRQQQAEQQRLARRLRGRRYRRLVHEWSEFLEGPVPPEPGEACPDAARPVRAVAAERIRKAFDRVRRRGRDVDGDTPAGTVHRLRIECKKLRYLLEFFRNLFDADRVAPFLRSLRRLQDYLGDFNDCDVQQAELRAIAEGMLEREGAASDTLLAMGCLVGRLEQRQAELRRAVVQNVRSFAGDSSRDRLRELLR